MTSTYALRDDLDLTLAGLAEQIGSAHNPEDQVDLDSIKINTNASDPTLTIGGRDLPVTDTGLTALADALQVPAPFFKRLGERGGMQAQGDLLTLALDHSPGGVVRAEYVEDQGLVGIYDLNAMRIRPRQLVNLAERVLGTADSPVQRLVNTNAMFSFDVHVPFGGSTGVFGDADSEVLAPEALGHYSWATGLPITTDHRVGDLTAGGLRISYDMKRGLVPSVQPWMMRLACTNGMETTTELTKVDARGLSVEEVLADLEAKAEAAFSRLEAEAAHLYDMRNQEVTNPERRLRALARERGIPDRSLMRLLDAAPETLGETTNEFEVVSVLTNLANQGGSEGGRLALERAGGHIVTENALRCHSCNHALVL